MSNNPKFLTGYIDGDYLCDEIDDFIEQWHLIQPNETLYEFLGFNEDEWEVWVLDSSTLPQIAISREKGIPLATQLSNAQDYAMAARSDRPLEAEQVIQWLKNHGHA